MTEDEYTKCEVCMTGHATRRVKSLLSEDKYFFYCTPCVEQGAEPIRVVNELLAHTPRWALQPWQLEVYTWTPEDTYISVYDLLERERP